MKTIARHDSLAALGVIVLPLLLVVGAGLCILPILAVLGLALVDSHEG